MTVAVVLANVALTGTPVVVVVVEGIVVSIVGDVTAVGDVTGAEARGDPPQAPRMTTEHASQVVNVRIVATPRRSCSDGTVGVRRRFIGRSSFRQLYVCKASGETSMTFPIPVQSAAKSLIAEFIEAGVDSRCIVRVKTIAAVRAAPARLPCAASAADENSGSNVSLTRESSLEPRPSMTAWNA